MVFARQFPGKGTNYGEETRRSRKTVSECDAAPAFSDSSVDASLSLVAGTLIRPSGTFSPHGEKGNKAWLSRDAPIVALLPAARGEKVPEGRMRALSGHSCLREAACLR
jgi:hypothetical protein